LIADLRNELNTHLATPAPPRKLCLFRVLLGGTATVTIFPLSKHTGEGGGVGDILTFSSRLVYLKFTWEVPFPHFPVELSPHSHCYKLSRSKVSGWGPPLLPSLAGLFIYSSVRDCPFLPLCLSGALPSLLHVFFCCWSLLLNFLFFLFFPGWGSVCPGDYADLAQGCLWVNSSFLFCVVIFNSSLSFLYSDLCLTLVFVEVFSEFIYLFLCLLMFFIFCVLKFLECILYILVNLV
jgi:hypothetical protein